MRPAGLVRRVVQVILGLVPLLAAGCLAGYVYPKVMLVPRIDIEAPAVQVWAFAVHAQRERCLSLAPSHEITLRPLPQESTIAPQAEFTLERGYWMSGGMRLSEHVSHRLCVRLYRRGYRTAEVGSWQLFENVRWVKAQGPADLEQAIDALIAPPPEGPAAWDDRESSFNHLAAGSTDPRHRQALVFALSEYDLLAKLPGLDETTRLRLRDKVRQLRERVDK
jgi:hypothetical protein